MIPLPQALQDCPENHLPAREQEAWLAEGTELTRWVMQCVLNRTAVLRHPDDNTIKRVVRHGDVLVAAPLRWAPMNRVAASTRQASGRGRDRSRRTRAGS